MGFQQQEQMLERREGKKLSKEKRATMTKFQRDFNRNLTNLARARSAAKNAEILLKKNSKLAASAIRVLMPRASMEVGNLSEAEQKIWEGRRDVISRIHQTLRKATFSELPKGDREVLLDVLQAYKKVGNQEMKSIASGMASQLQANPLFVDDDLDTLTRQVSGARAKKFIEYGTQSLDQPAGSTAPVKNEKSTFDMSFTPIK
jgi:hypothetical protein